MDIQTQKSYLVFHDRVLSACGSELCFLPESQPNPRSAHWPGHSIVTKKTGLSGYSQSDLDKVALRLNQRPRKTLGFETPASKLQASVAAIH